MPKHLSCPLREPDVFNTGIPDPVLEQILPEIQPWVTLIFITVHSAYLAQALLC